MGKKLKILGVIVLIAVITVVLYFVTYQHSTETAKAYLNGTADVNVSKVSNGLFLDGKGNETAVIFYPGAKIEYDAYLPMFTLLASKGVDCYLVEMPFNFAFFAVDSADTIINNSSYDNYFMAGHSLGAAMASEYITHTNTTDGLILIGGYADKLVDVPTLSIYGSNDHIIDMDHYNKSKVLYINNFTEYVVEGGNHAQWGNYGVNEKDGPSNITAEEQQKVGVEEIVRFIDTYT